MPAKISISMFVALSLLGCSSFAEELLFEDKFDEGLSSRWQIVGLKKEDYRIRNGGLEMRVQSGKLTHDTPMIKVILPFTSSNTVIASVEVKLLDSFSESGEFAGMFLIDEQGAEFGAKKETIDGRLLFSPGDVEFVGKPGNESDLSLYTVKYWPAADRMGPLRIIVRDGYAHFQVGPSTDGEFTNFFHSAIRKKTDERGFSLVTASGPRDAAHWVRFDNFRVKR